jgi:hypothetical protein
MFSLTIVFGPGPMVWTLMFKTEEAARHEQHYIETTTDLLLRTKDDFGQETTIAKELFHGMMLEDLDQSKFAHIERALHQARTKVTGDKIAESDPVLKEAQRRAQGGMPMIQPAMQGFGTNGRFPS